MSSWHQPQGSNHTRVINMEVCHLTDRTVIQPVTVVRDRLP